MEPFVSRGIAFDPTDAHDHHNPDHPIQRWHAHINAGRIGTPTPLDPTEAENLARTTAVLRRATAQVRA